MAFKQSIWKYTLIFCVGLPLFNTLTGDRTCISQSTIAEINLLLEKTQEINKKLDEVDPRSDTLNQIIRKLESEVDSIQNTREIILINNPAAKLKSPEKEQFQAKLDILRDEIVSLKARTKTILQITPYFYRPRSLGDRPVQSWKEEIRIPNFFLYLSIGGILLTLVALSFWIVLWLRNESKQWDMYREFYQLLKQILAKGITLVSPTKTDGFEKTEINKGSNQKALRLGPRTENNDLYEDNGLETEKRNQRETYLEVFCRLYSTEVDGLSTEFTEYYKPIRVGVSNAMDRRRNIDIKPIFVTATDGDYYVAKSEKERQFLVVPRPGMAFQESSYGPGAMGVVFDCPTYNPQLRYRHVKVVKPAVFERDFTEAHWKLVERGKLELGEGE